jgi:hypothetical protein
MSTVQDWKYTVLSRFAGQYPPWSGSGRKIRKSSESIAFDLSGMGDISATEVSVFLATQGYEIGFEDDKPVWLLTEPGPDKSLTE